MKNPAMSQTAISITDAEYAWSPHRMHVGPPGD